MRTQTSGLWASTLLTKSYSGQGFFWSNMTSKIKSKQTEKLRLKIDRSKLNTAIQCWSRKQGVWDTSLLAGKTIMFSLSGMAFLLLFLSQQPIFNNDTLHSRQTVNNNLTAWWLAIPGLHAKDASGANFRLQVNQLPHSEFHPYHFL